MDGGGSSTRKSSRKGKSPLKLRDVPTPPPLPAIRDEEELTSIIQGIITAKALNNLYNGGRVISHDAIIDNLKNEYDVPKNISGKLGQRSNYSGDNLRSFIGSIKHEMEGDSKEQNEKPVTKGDEVVLCLRGCPWGEFHKCVVKAVDEHNSTVCVDLLLFPWNNKRSWSFPTSSCMALNKIDSLAIAYGVYANCAQDSAIFGSAIKRFQTTHKHLLDPSYDGRISDEARRWLKNLVYRFYNDAVFPAQLDPTNPDYTGLVPAEFLHSQKFVSVPSFDVWLEMRGEGYSGMKIMSYQKEVDLVDAKRWDAWNKNTRGPCSGTGQYHSFVSIEHTIVNVISTNRLSTYANWSIEPLRDNSVYLPYVAKQLLKTVRVANKTKPGQVHLLGGDAYKDMCYLCGKKRLSRWGNSEIENLVTSFLDIQISPKNQIVRVYRCQSCANLCIILRESLAVDLNGPRIEDSTDDSDYFVMQVAIKLQEYARISF